MIKINKIGEIKGIPIFHQKMPADVKSVSLSWVLFTGGADDTSVDLPGLYHWFEHVPFRGTKKFPKGSSQIDGQFTMMVGHVNAWTNPYATCFHANIHIDQWKLALITITDLIANPLLREEDVNAEREIIQQEIAGRLASAGGYYSYHLPEILYRDHPYGHHVLGSEKSLKAMNVNTLRLAREKGYDRSRMVFFCVGNISNEDLLSEIEKLVPELPDNGLSERRHGAWYGDLPSWNNETVKVDTNFATSIVSLLFPFKENRGLNEFSKMKICWLLDAVFGYGGMTSPLKRIVREERHLVYGCHTTWSNISGGGYFGFSASAKKENIPKILDAFRDVLKDPELTSDRRLSEMKMCNKASTEMMPIDPGDYRNTAVIYYIDSDGVLLDQNKVIDEIDSWTMDDIKGALKMFDNDLSKTIIFEGNGKV